MGSWAAAFALAVAVTLLTVPFLRRLALAIGFVDERCVGQSHRAPVPYLGGVGLMLGVLVPLSIQSGASPRVGVIALGAAVLGTIGLIDDDRHVHPGYRVWAEVAVAAATVAVGLRISATGATPTDTALTMLWVVGITNAINLLDNMDGLAAGVVASAAAAVLTLGITGEQVVVASVAAALTGACLAFLPFNRRPAKIFMGDAGSLFLGFVLSILTIDVSPALSPPVSFAVPLMLLAVPILDTTTVTVARLRRHRSVVVGGKDHLSHRLVTRGLSRRGAVKVLVGAQILLGVMAVLAGREVVPLWWAVAGTGAIVAALIAVTLPVNVYSDPVLGVPRRVKLLSAGCLAAIPVMSVPAALAMAGAAAPAKAGAESAKNALDALRVGDTEATVGLFTAAEQSFARAQRRLRQPLVPLGRVIPGLASNLDASTKLVSIGKSLSTAGIALSQVSDPDRLRVTSGMVPLQELRRLAPDLERASALVDDSAQQVAKLNRSFLVPSLRDAADDLLSRLRRESGPARLAAHSARLMPALLGADNPRRYFLAFQNNAELRGSGGFMGNWGELQAASGRLTLERFGRLDDLNLPDRSPPVLHVPPEFLDRWRRFNPVQFWQQVNVSPDFPTTAQLISDLYPGSGGRPVDGVIAIDPVGLSALLRLTGPVNVPGWPEAITAENVIDATLREAYVRFPAQDARVAFLGEVARRVTEAFASGDLGSPANVGAAMSGAARGGHVKLYLTRPEEQQLARELGADGSLPPPVGDSLAVVNQNLAANKVDYYFRRRIEYEALIDPDREPAALTARVRVLMRNDAPASGLPPTVIGPYDERFEPGENRTYVSVYSPFRVRSATLGGKPADIESQTELGYQVASVTVSIPSKESRMVEMFLEGRVDLASGGWYRLDVDHQTSLQPDDVRVSIRVPEGWRIAEATGVRIDGDGRSAVAEGPMDHRTTKRVRLERTGWRGVLERLLLDEL